MASSKGGAAAVSAMNPARRAVLRAAVLLAAGARPMGALPAPSPSPGDYLGPHFPYSLFDALPSEEINSKGGMIDIAFVPDPGARRKAAISDWVAQSAQAIATYFGHFPVPRLRMLVVTVTGNAIHGTTWGNFGAATRITVGQDAPDSEVAQNWIMAHELVHVAFPSLRRDHLWLEEGLSTYVGPVARAAAGLVSPEYVWGWFRWGMPHGLPQPGDQGLDLTHSWGRTFWGGALFCLLADLGIRSRTDGRRGLQTALRAILAAGGNGEAHWPMARVLDVGDRATGVPVLRELYEKMKDRPVVVDLARLWSELGVSNANGVVSFDDAAPLAVTRRAITARLGVR